METPARPVISAVLIESRLQDHLEYASSQVDMISEVYSTNTKRLIADLTAEAYRRGMADGFAQRVYADGEDSE